MIIAGMPQNLAKPNENYVIREFDIFSVLKNNQNIIMMPGRYKVEPAFEPIKPSNTDPKKIETGTALDPWGDTIKFNYKPKYKLQTAEQISAISDNVEKQLYNKFANLIQSITTEYNGSDTFTVSIIQKP